MATNTQVSSAPPTVCFLHHCLELFSMVLQLHPVTRAQNRALVTSLLHTIAEFPLAIWLSSANASQQHVMPAACCSAPWSSWTGGGAVEGKTEDVQAWFGRNDLPNERTKADLGAVINELRAVHGAKKVVCQGFCWGGWWAVWLAAQRSAPEVGLIATAAFVHCSALTCCAPTDIALCPHQATAPACYFLTCCLVPVM